MRQPASDVFGIGRPAEVSTVKLRTIAIAQQHVLEGFPTPISLKGIE